MFRNAGRWVLRKLAVVFISVFHYRIQVRLLSLLCVGGRWQLPWHEVSNRNPSFLVPSNKIFKRVLLRSILGEVHVFWRHIENTLPERNHGGEETGDDTDYDDKLVSDLVFYAQSTITVISGRATVTTTTRKRRRRGRRRRWRRRRRKRRRSRRRRRWWRKGD